MSADDRDADDRAAGQDRLLERARRVLPHERPYGSVLATRHAGGSYPHYGGRASGGRFTDLAGREYIDWFLGGGPLTLGHRPDAIVHAIAAQLEHGINLSLPCPTEVEVAEQVCALFPGVEQVQFGKNGSDVTSAAVRLARYLTGRDHVMMSGYHGFQDWSVAPSHGDCGIPQAVRELVHEFGYNDLDGAERLVAERGPEVAAIVVEPVRYAAPDPEFLHGLRRLADASGALLVFDEIVTGLRVARGGAQELCDVRADLTCLAKSLANGMPLSALAGPRRLMKHMPWTHFGMTYRRDALSLAAARATLEVHGTNDVAGHLAHIGTALREQFTAAATEVGLPWSLDGHPAMLHMRIAGGGRLSDRGAEQLFVELCQRRGVYVELHRLLPCWAHTLDDVARTGEVFRAAMRTVATAMDDGLDLHLDGPVDASLREGDGPGDDAAWESDRGPCPFPGLPGTVRDAAVTRTWYPAGAEGAIELGAGSARLRIGAVPRGGSATRMLSLGVALDAPFDVVASYRLHECDSRDAAVSIRLVAVGDDDSTWCAAKHDFAFARPAWSAASFGPVHVQIPCAYGVAAGRLRLTYDGRSMHAYHETEELERIGSGSDIPPQAMRISFELRVDGASRSVEVELSSLELRPVQESRTLRNEALDVDRDRGAEDTGGAVENPVPPSR